MAQDAFVTELGADYDVQEAQHAWPLVPPMEWRGWARIAARLNLPRPAATTAAADAEAQGPPGRRGAAPLGVAAFKALTVGGRRLLDAPSLLRE
jgi:hypothetical protein